MIIMAKPNGLCQVLTPTPSGNILYDNFCFVTNCCRFSKFRRLAYQNGGLTYVKPHTFILLFFDTQPLPINLTAPIETAMPLEKIPASHLMTIEKRGGNEHGSDKQV